MYASLYYLFVDLLDVYLCVLPTLYGVAKQAYFTINDGVGDGVAPRA